MARNVLVRWILVGVALVAFQALMLYPLQRSMDLPTWDESNQMGWGAAFAAGSGTLQDLSSSPLYNLFYAPLTQASGRIGSIFSAKYAITLGVTLLLYALLLRSTQACMLSALLTLSWAVSRFNLSATLYVYHFALLFFLLALLYCNRSRPVALVLLFLCALARLEYLLVLLPYAGYALLLSIRRDRHAVFPKSVQGVARISTLAALGLFLALALYTSRYIDDWSVGGERGWHAFRQHYALGQVQAGRATIDPWIDYGTLVARDFPDRESTLGAMAGNPRAFALHVAGNISRLPGSVLGLLEPYRHSSRWPLYLAVLLVLALGPALALVRRRRRYLAAWRARLLALGDVAVLAALAPLTLLPGLVVWAKVSYVLPLLPVLLLSAGTGIAAADDSLEDPAPAKRRAMLYGITAAVLICFTALAQRPFDRPGRRRPVYEKVTALQAIWPETQARLLGVGASWYANYLGKDRCIPIEPLASVAGKEEMPHRVGLESLIRDQRPDVVLVNRMLVQSSHFQVSSLSALTPDRWRRHDLGDEAFFFATQD